MIVWIYLKANFHFTWSWAMSCCVFNIKIASSQVFSGPLYPSTTISQHFFTQLSLSIFSTCPNHLSTPLFVCRLLCLPTSGDISNCQKSFYPSMSHYTSPIPSWHFSPVFQFIFFHCLGFTTIKNNTPEKFTFCAVKTQPAQP